MSIDFRQPVLPIPKDMSAIPEAKISWPDLSAQSPTGGSTTPAAATTTPKKEYVDQNRTGKADMLVDVMNDAKDILTQNGLAEGDDAVLASLMMNEGGRNGRRSTLGNYFKGQAGQLDEVLKAQSIDPKTLADDPKAREALEKSLPEDQRFLLDRVISGEIKLDEINTPAGLQKLTEAGIDKRVEQYQEMERLKKDKKDNGKLSKKDAARLKELEGMSGKAVGFDRVDAQMDSKFADMSGLSEERFREIYAEGQQRFEPHIYRKARANFDNQVEAYMAGDKEDPMRVKAGGVGTAELSETDVTKMQDGGNHDLLADLSTSYGTAQIMGLYAHNGLLKAKDGAGEDVSYDLEALKGSKDRLSPNTEDVNMQIAFLNMKAGYDSDKLGDSLSDVDSLIQLYNGAAPGTALHTGYKNKLDPNKTEYERVKAEKEAAAAAEAEKAQQGPNGHFRD